tara:strand:- start:2910 stop:3209 length:300 start_codon:yes stop_codon:yes gene_type:complete
MNKKTNIKKTNKKNKKIICYTGDDTTKMGEHTREEFIKIVDATWEKNKKFYLKYGEKKPKTLKQWMKWTGAEYTSLKECMKNVKQMEKMLKKINRKLKK